MEESAGLFAFHVSGSIFFENAQLDDLTISLMFRIKSTVYAGLYLVLTIWRLSMTCHVFVYVFSPVVIEFVAWSRCCGFH